MNGAQRKRPAYFFLTSAPRQRRTIRVASRLVIDADTPELAPQTRSDEAELDFRRRNLQLEDSAR